MVVRARVFAAAAAVLGLSGCEDLSSSLAEGLAQVGAPRDATAAGIRTLSLLDGSIRVRGPNGYCVDQGASDARRGFAVLVGCAVVSDSAAVMPTLDGLITVQFGAPDTASVTGNEEAFAAFLRSDAGRGLLSASGAPGQAPQVVTITDSAAVLARIEDGSTPTIPGTSGLQWRGFLDVGGRLVTVNVLSLDRKPLSAAEGERLLVVTMAELGEVNERAAVAVSAEDEGS